MSRLSQGPPEPEHSGYRSGQVIRNIDWRAWEKVKQIAPTNLHMELSYMYIIKTPTDLDPTRVLLDPKARERAFVEFEPGNQVSLAAIGRNPDLWPDETGFVLEGTEFRGTRSEEGVDAVYRSEGAIWLIREQELDIVTPMILHSHRQVERRAFLYFSGEHSFAQAWARVQAAAGEKGIPHPLLVITDVNDAPIVISTEAEWRTIMDEHVKVTGLPTKPSGTDLVAYAWGLDGDKYRIGDA